MTRIRKTNRIPTQGRAALTTFMTDMWATPAVTNRLSPTGGVIMPISMLTTMMMPRWIGSMPSSMAIGKTSGATRISALWPSEQRSFMGRFLVRKSHIALSVANERIAALPSDGESLIALGPIVAATEAHVINADNEPFEALIAAAAGRIQSAKGGWRDAAHLVALAKDEAAKFARTRAGERAGQIVAAARVKVESLVKDDLGSLDEELVSTEESRVGLAHLGEIGRIVDDNERTLFPLLPIIGHRYQPGVWNP